MNLNNLKIGVLFTAYNCGNYINECLNPWFNLKNNFNFKFAINTCLLYTSPSPRDRQKSRMPSSA